MDTGFAELRAANSATLAAANKMQAHIHNQTIVIKGQAGAIQNQNTTILMLNKKIQEQQSALLATSAQLDSQKAMVKFLSGRSSMLQKKIDFLLADESRACRKVIHINGNAIRVEWTHKKSMDRAVWNLQTKATEANTHNLLEGSTRKKAAKGKPSFYKYAPAPVEVEAGLAQLYAMDNGQAASGTATAASTSSHPASSSTGPPPPAAIPPVTAQELEHMWQDFSSVFCSDNMIPPAAPSAQPLPLPPTMLGSATAKPLDFVALQTSSSSSSSGSGSMVPASSSAVSTAVTGAPATITTGICSSLVIDLTDGCSIESPSIRKRPRVQSPERSAEPKVDGAGSIAGSSLHRANGVNDSSHSVGLGRLPTISHLPQASAASSDSQPNSAAAVAPSKSSSFRTTLSTSSGARVPNAPSHATQCVVSDKIVPLEVRGAPQPWHDAADGPVRQHVIACMLSCIDGTPEMQRLPSWREARRVGCWKTEARLYSSCTTRGEYLQRAQNSHLRQADLTRY